MIELENIELPLFKSFISLMQLEKGMAHKSVSPDSYLLLVDTLRQGYLLNTRDELIFFCKKLWLKPFHRNSSVLNEKILEELLIAHLEENNRSNPEIKESKPETLNDQGTTTNQKKEELPAQKTPEKDPAKEDVKKESPEKNTEILSSEQGGALFLSIGEVAAADEVGKKDYSQLFDKKSYQFNYQYLPVNRRFIEQTIRSLRYKLKGIGHPVIDIPATVAKTASRGYFDDWETEEEDGFITRWTLLFDREGSMVAFHHFQDALFDAAMSGTLKNEGETYYFRNVVSNVLYRNPQRTRTRSFQSFADDTRKNILIVSDAGAARGNRNVDRIKGTSEMLHNLRKHKIAWLNPLPKSRWQNSSAETIATYVHMFEPGDDNADNLGNIVQLFKSKIISQKT